MQDVWAWLAPYASIIIGLVVAFVLSIGVGGVVVPCFHAQQAAKLPDPGEPDKDKRIHPNLTGTIERAAFTLFTIVPGPAISTPMMLAWLTLKMASHWNKPSPQPEKQAAWNRHAFLGLLSGFVSLCFAWAAGMIARLIIGIDTLPLPHQP